MQAKCEFVNRLDLGGVMFWELGADVKSGPQSLLETAYCTFGRSIDSLSNRLDHSLSKFDNIRDAKRQ